MNKSIIALAILTSVTGVAQAATVKASDVKFKSGWDLEAIQSQTNGIITDNSDRISKLTGDVRQVERGNLLRDDRIKTAGDKADAALQGVAKNGSDILALQKQAGTFVTKPELAAGLAGKVDKSTFLTDQKRQDDEITKNKVDQAFRDKGQDSLIQQNGSKADAALQGVATNATAIQQKANASDVLAADKALAGRIDTNENAIKTESQTREQADKNLYKEIDQRVTKTDFADDQKRQDDALAQTVKDQAQTDRDQDKLTQQLHADTQQKLNDRVTKTEFATDQQRQEDAWAAYQQQSATSHQQANQAIASNTQRLNQQQKQLDGMKAQQDTDRKEYRNGISGLAAIQGIPEVARGQDFFIGAGVGTFQGATSVAVGGSAFVTENTKVKASVSFNNGGDAVVSAGFGVGF